MRQIRWGAILWALAAWLGAFSPLAEGQTQTPPEDLNLYGGGAKAAAMGGAFIGLADDATAAFWNPAGLTQSDRIYTGLQFRYQRHRVHNKLDAQEPLSFLYNNYSRNNIWNFNFASFNAPVFVKGHRFYLSASWLRGQDGRFRARYRLDDLSDVGPIEDDPSVAITGFESFAQAAGGTKVVTLAAATQFKEEVLAGGLGLNIYIGNGYDSVRSTFDFLLSAAGIDLVGLQAIDQTDRRDFIGVNFTVGTLLHWDKYSLGLTARTPFKLETTHDQRFRSGIYERTPDSLLLLTENSLLLETKTQVEMPLHLGAGLVYRPQEQLLFAVDYEYKAFGKSQTFRQADSLNPRSEFVVTDPEWKDVHQVRLGMEYMITTAWGNIPVRAGFRTEPLPLRHVTNAVDSTATVVGFSPTGRLSFQHGDQQFGEVYSLGTGIHWSQVRLDLTYEYLSSTAYGDGHFVDNLLKPQYIYFQNNRRQRLSLGFTGFF